MSLLVTVFSACESNQFNSKEVSFKNESNQDPTGLKLFLDNENIGEVKKEGKEWYFILPADFEEYQHQFIYSISMREEHYVHVLKSDSLHSEVVLAEENYMLTMKDGPFKELLHHVDSLINPPNEITKERGEELMKQIDSLGYIPTILKNWPILRERVNKRKTIIFRTIKERYKTSF